MDGHTHHTHNNGGATHAMTSVADSRGSIQYTENIARFAAELRNAGFKHGLSEIVDSMRLIEEIGLESQSTLRAALCSLFSKSEIDIARFNFVFDKYFVGLEQQEHNAREEVQYQIERKNIIAKNADELRFQGEKLDLPESLIEVYANMPDIEKDRLKSFLEQTSMGKNVGPKFKPVTEKLIKGKLQRQANSSASGAGAGMGLSEQESLLYKSISSISEEEVPQALRLIRVLVRRINANISREYKKSSRRGQLDMKASINKSLSTGGTIYKLRFRRKRRRKQRMIILCDVSASMLLFSGFGIQFIHGMKIAADKSDVFLFSEGIEAINAKDMQSLSAFESRVVSSRLWGRGTNLNSALMSIQQNSDINLNGSIVLIFSDGKTMQVHQTRHQLMQLRRKCKKILWMNPLPEQDWNSMPWISAYRKNCTMLDCSTLERLGTACAQSMHIF